MLGLSLPINLPFPFEESQPLVLQACPHPALWDYLLEMPSLSPFDVDPFLPKNQRVLLAAARFAVHHIGKDTAEERSLTRPSSSDEVRWQWILLETVLDSTCSGRIRAGPGKSHYAQQFPSFRR